MHACKLVYANNNNQQIEYERVHSRATTSTIIIIINETNFSAYNHLICFTSASVCFIALQHGQNNNDHQNDGACLCACVRYSFSLASRSNRPVCALFFSTSALFVGHMDSSMIAFTAILWSA